MPNPHRYNGKELFQRQNQQLPWFGWIGQKKKKKYRVRWQLNIKNLENNSLIKFLGNMGLSIKSLYLWKYYY